MQRTFDRAQDKTVISVKRLSVDVHFSECQAFLS